MIHINDLKKVGFKEEQAAVIIRSLMDSREMDLANLATKEQVANIERNMVTKTYFAEVIAGVKEELKAEIAEVKVALKDLQINLIKWMVGLMIAFSGIIFAGIQLINI